MELITEAQLKILDLDQSLQRMLRVGWPESWLQLNLPLGSTRALLLIDTGYARTPRRVAEILGVGRTNVTGMLDKLEAEGLITRAIDPNDRRSFLLDLTEKGRALSRQIDEIRREQLGKALDRMAPAELEALQQGLEALTFSMKAVTRIIIEKNKIKEVNI